MKRPKIELSDDPRELRQWLYGQVPGLEDTYSQGEPVEAARLLRDWVGSIATFSHRDLLLDHNKLKAHELLEGALSFRGGLWCGGVAELYMRLVRLIPGVVAAKYNYGVRSEDGESVTHMTVLVGTTEGEAYNLDPYIGYDWEMPFGEVLGHIKAKRYHVVRMRSVPLPRPAIVLPGQEPSYSWLFPEGLPEPIEYEDRLVYQGATPSWSALFAPGTPNRLRADRYRGKQPLDEWLLDLMLVGPELGRFSDEGGWNEFACVRRLFYSMVEA